jgi:acyl-CoA reductase-like NAD-dependent aldehyde dehydrogenase
MMHMKPYIGGKWYETGRTRTIRNPYDNTPVSRVGVVEDEGVEAALQAAELGFRILRGMERYQRADILQKMGEGIRRRAERFAALICRESGKPIQLAEVEVRRVVDVFTFAAHACLSQQGESFLPSITEDQAGFYGLSQRFPVGPTLAIETFSFPLGDVANRVAPALAAGVSLIVKPASRTPTTALLLAEVAMEAGVPGGTLNVVPVDRDAAARIVADDRVKLVFFSGSPDSGQTPGSVQRILAHKSIFEEVEQHLLEITERKMPAGNPAEPGVLVGPLIDAASADRVMDWIQAAVDSGAGVLAGGERRGNIVEPTLLADPGGGRRIRGVPVVGPVAVLGSYETFSQAITEVNRTEYGLQVGVFTRDVNQAFRAFQEMQVGTVTVNDFPPLRFDHLPYGGGKHAGCGHQGIRWAMEEMTELRLMVLNLA